MTDELKPCPFCGVTFEIWCDKYRTWALAKHKPECFFPSKHNHEIPEQDFDAWNTRAERTTELIVAADDLGKDLYPCMCFQCGYTKLDDFWRKNHVNYCPNCGAKVADSATSGYLVADKPTDSETVTTCATTGEQRFGPGWPDTWLIAK